MRSIEYENGKKITYKVPLLEVCWSGLRNFRTNFLLIFIIPAILFRNFGDFLVRAVFPKQCLSYFWDEFISY